MSSPLVRFVAGFSPVLSFTGAAPAADQAQIQQSLAKAAGYLEANLGKEGDEGVRALGALALLKTNMPTTTPVLRDSIQIVLNRVQNGEYKPGSHHIYQAGVEATLLADANPETFRPQLEAIAKYLISMQLPNGGWDYPSGRKGEGDTSVTQYASLGLWSAHRAGVEIPMTTWDGALNWHIATQNSDGGFRYVANSEEGYERGGSSINLTLAALGSMLIAARHAFPGQADSLVQILDLKQERLGVVRNDKLGGVLRAVDLTKVAGGAADSATPAATGKSTVDIAQLKQTLERAFGWASGRVGPTKGDPHYADYYYYTLERTGALADVAQFGRFNWFDGCSTELVSKQLPDGHWNISTFAVRDTAFATLFLVRSTGKTLKRTTPLDPIKGGLTKGNRGGLENLEDLVATGGDVVSQKKLGPLDELLAKLAVPGDIDFDDVQEQIVEQVQIGDRNTLIGQKDLLIKLAKHPDGEVRRTAIWALGRTGDMSLAKLLINALDDTELSVLTEARNALCWLARKPHGLGEAAEPLAALPEGASEDQRQAAIAAWHAELVRNWGNWYLENRPYADRGDEFEAELLQKIARAK
jgi:hypothetical protein